ncbi:PepSY-associated TM helix domain-containing protein [Planctomicrobium piriforme]|uniref:Uncharacterized iron-regulated membrane protein n=1 Tax=Planctomicrobium piriforme TaxID=1576369 RepID=A0A1I3CJJ9_9PLAN|nr:PepSY-associated TM helix domain-containing protein [Planctomicrobium piriforme]SFH74774.1 Uncharacterized iron-regulated membrane protein [Planctomicrobium piriforme]
MRRRTFRKIWLLTHRWLGVTVGLLLALTSLTGSVLVFRSMIDEQLNPQIFRTVPNESRCSLEEVLSAAQNSTAAQTGKISFVDFPRSVNGIWTVWFQTGTKSAPQLTKVYVDPFRTVITGQRVHGADLMTWIFKLHTELLAGHTGETIVGIAGIVLMLSVISGILLWWPLWRHSWRSAFSIRSGMLFNYDLHKVTGIFNSPLLLVMAFTGIYLTFPAWIAPCVKFILAEHARPAPQPRSTPMAGVDRISADRVMEIVTDLYPKGRIRRLHPPSTPEGTFVVRFWQPGDANRSLGSSRVWIDPYRGTVLGVKDSKQQTAADAFISWQLPLHNGEALGLVGRWLAFVTGFAPLALYVTGFLIWRRKHRSRTQTRSPITKESPWQTS